MKFTQLISPTFPNVQKKEKLMYSFHTHHTTTMKATRAAMKNSCRKSVPM